MQVGMSALCQKRTERLSSNADDRHDNGEFCQIRQGHSVRPEGIQPFHRQVLLQLGHLGLS